ncbi:rabankyrin-5-like isoform X2 [Dendronephthya gigantea]|uniref:rabankyrin-5-like isoform X2 n=1 Tax=Dendronephthya gigantea TaxID=151771 RepID=UPI00106D087F|nr:rabankyrin-5-like isoform X2 [Dendronephthya gigantea]
MANDVELQKAQNHLSLLRQEYVKLQNKYVELEQKYNLLVVQSGGGEFEKESFVARLLNSVAELYDKELYSDITVKFAGQMLSAHKFIMAARSDFWSSRDLNELSELELTDISAEVGLALMRWVYTDKVAIKSEENFLVDLVKAANRYKLAELRGRCERMLMSSVSVSNCIKFYQTAEDIGAEGLRKYCEEIITSHWSDLKTEDFANMSASLLYQMFKSKSSFPLHLAIKHHREDVVFLFLIEFNSQLPKKLDEFDPSMGGVPLDIALVEQQESIAKQLIMNGCDVDVPDSEGSCLLHKAIERGDEFASTFLIKNGAKVNAVTTEQISPLHLAASYKAWSAMHEKAANSANRTSAEGMCRVAQLLLSSSADVNLQDSNGCTPLHQSILSQNDQVFNILLKQSKIDLELKDNRGRTPLWLALTVPDDKINPDDEDSVPARLSQAGASPDSLDISSGDSLLHLAAAQSRQNAGLFLASHGAEPNVTNKLGETPLHSACRSGLINLVSKLLHCGANPNIQTSETEELKKKSVERRRVRLETRAEARRKAVAIAKEIENQKLQAAQAAEEIEKRKKRGSSATASESRSEYNPNDSFEADLGINNPFVEPDKRPESPSDVNNPFLDDLRAAAAASAVARGDSNPFDSPPLVEQKNKEHSEKGLAEILKPRDEFSEAEIEELILEHNLYDESLNGLVVDCSGKTPLHYSIIEKHENVINCFKEYDDMVSSGGRLNLAPDFDICDSEEQSALEHALLTAQYRLAETILDAGASIDLRDSEGCSLMLKTIKRKDVPSALFLIEHGADINVRSKENKSALQLAISYRLQPVVDSLCKNGADPNVNDEYGNCPLWAAMKSKQFGIAETLVSYNCDTNVWHKGPNNCTQSLLHRAIHEKDEDAGCFLIRCRCDVNSPRRPSADGTGGVEAWDGLTPLHLACIAGLDKIVQFLVQENAQVNSQDSEGRGPIHVSIFSGHSIPTQLLLSHPELNLTLEDRTGQTPFAVALDTKDHKSAEAILSREPNAAERYDKKGRNYLHRAILSGDVETVLFLISVNANIHTPVQDSSRTTPLHLAVQAGSEIIVRHLILANANVNAVDKHKRTPLHIAADNDRANILAILIQNGVNVNEVDSKNNNALHLAVQQGHINSVRVLLTESSVDISAVNDRGQNALHTLAQYGRDNAGSIFEIIRQNSPDFPLNSVDADENTALLLAYLNGNGRLCRELLKNGSSLGAINKNGISIFNAEVASKKLLFSLLDLLNSEPPWSDGNFCHECSVKFSVTNRKHHCRHCGRLLCAKCSSKQIPILKYEQTKPVRVCEVCHDMLNNVGTSFY